MPGQTGDLEQSLLDSMDGDHRLSSGTHAPHADNVVDFVQMTGLAAPRRGRPAATLERSRSALRDTALHPLIFFEKGVGDVDAAMDPGYPIVPELEGPGGDFEPAPRDEGAIDSTTGLTEIISDLRQRYTSIVEPEGPGSAPGQNEFALYAPRPPVQGKEDDAPSRASFSEIHEWLEDDRATLGSGVDAGSSMTREPDQADFESEDSTAAGEEVPSGSPNDLEEAKELLKELELNNESDARIEEDVSAEFEASDLLASLPPHVSAPPLASHRRPRYRRRRKLGRWALRGLMVLVVAVLATSVVQFFLNQAETPQATFRAAQRLLDDGRYVQASKAFQAFARRFPSEIETPDALFLAGYAMQLTPSSPRTDSRRAHADALALLEHFIVEYPLHPKAARAETLIGVLYFRMGRHAEVINILRDPERRLRDPGAYLTTLRTLGRSYAALSQIESARDVFMRAAAIEENFAPDQDYVELGSLYQKLAERSVSEEAKLGYWERAMEQWDFALRVPGVLKSRRDDIRLMRDLVESKLAYSGIPTIGEEESSGGF